MIQNCGAPQLWTMDRSCNMKLRQNESEIFVSLIWLSFNELQFHLFRTPLYTFWSKREDARLVLRPLHQEPHFIPSQCFLPEDLFFLFVFPYVCSMVSGKEALGRFGGPKTVTPETVTKKKNYFSLSILCFVICPFRCDGYWGDGFGIP